MLLLLPLLASCGTGSTSPAAVVESVTMSYALDADYRPMQPTEHYAPQSRFYCAALVRGLRPGMVVSARWLYQGNLIKRTDYVVQQTGNGYVGFELTNDKPPWPEGQYSVEILIDHVHAGGTAFTVP